MERVRGLGWCSLQTLVEGEGWREERKGGRGETDRQTCRQADRQRETETQRETDRQTDRDRQR